MLKVQDQQRNRSLWQLLNILSDFFQTAVPVPSIETPASVGAMPIRETGASNTVLYFSFTA